MPSLLTLVLLIVAIVVPIALGRLLAARRLGWTRRRVVLTAAFPVPASLVALVVGLAMAIAWDDESGFVLALVQVVPGVAFATLLFGLGLAFAAIGFRLSGRSAAGARPVDKIFE